LPQWKSGEPHTLPVNDTNGMDEICFWNRIQHARQQCSHLSVRIVTAAKEDDSWIWRTAERKKLGKVEG
jgi:hypothetical protein